MGCVPMGAPKAECLELTDDNTLVYTSAIGEVKIIPLPNIEPVQPTTFDNCKNCGAGRAASTCDYCGTTT